MSDELDIFASFKAAAERYIGVIESLGEEDCAERLPDLAGALSALYTKALHLPDVWDDAWTFPGEREWTDEEWSDTLRSTDNFRDLSGR